MANDNEKHIWTVCIEIRGNIKTITPHYMKDIDDVNGLIVQWSESGL